VSDDAIVHNHIVSAQIGDEMVQECREHGQAQDAVLYRRWSFEHRRKARELLTEGGQQ